MKLQIVIIAVILHVLTSALMAAQPVEAKALRNSAFKGPWEDRGTLNGWLLARMLFNYKAQITLLPKVEIELHEEQKIPQESLGEALWRDIDQQTAEPHYEGFITYMKAYVTDQVQGYPDGQTLFAIFDYVSAQYSSDLLFERVLKFHSIPRPRFHDREEYTDWASKRAVIQSLADMIVATQKERQEHGLSHQRRYEHLANYGKLQDFPVRYTLNDFVEKYKGTIIPLQLLTIGLSYAMLLF